MTLVLLILAEIAVLIISAAVGILCYRYLWRQYKGALIIPIFAILLLSLTMIGLSYWTFPAYIGSVMVSPLKPDTYPIVGYVENNKSYFIIINRDKDINFAGEQYTIKIDKINNIKFEHGDTRELVIKEADYTKSVTIYSPEIKK